MAIKKLPRQRETLRQLAKRNKKETKISKLLLMPSVFDDLIVDFNLYVTSHLPELLSIGMCSAS